MHSRQQRQQVAGAGRRGRQQQLRMLDDEVNPEVRAVIVCSSVHPPLTLSTD